MKQKSRCFYPQYSPLKKKNCLLLRIMFLPILGTAHQSIYMQQYYFCSPKTRFTSVFFKHSYPKDYSLKVLQLKRTLLKLPPKHFCQKLQLLFFLIIIIKDTITIRLSWKQARILVQNTVTSQVMPGSSPLRSYCKHNPL